MMRAFFTSWRMRAEAPPEDSFGVDHAWKALEFVIGLVKYAEAKAIATLATAGVLGQILFLLVRAAPSRSAVVFVTCAGLGALLTLSAAIFAACVLWPRTSTKRHYPNLLYFGDLAARNGLTELGYMREFSDMIRDPDRVVAELAGQIWANASIAQLKFRFANRCVAAMLGAAVMVLTTACLSALLHY